MVSRLEVVLAVAALLSGAACASGTPSNPSSASSTGVASSLGTAAASSFSTGGSGSTVGSGSSIGSGSTSGGGTTAPGSASGSSTGSCESANCPGNDAGGGPTYDFPCGTNPPCLLSQSCCVDTSGSSALMACMAQCPDPADELDCDGPEQCSAGAPVCCGIEVLSGGSSPNCMVSALGTHCQSSCATTFAQGCSGTNQVTLCHTSQDCPDPSNGECCQFTQNGATLTFCASSALALFADGCF